MKQEKNTKIERNLTNFAILIFFQQIFTQIYFKNKKTKKKVSGNVTVETVLNMLFDISSE